VFFWLGRANFGRNFPEMQNERHHTVWLAGWAGQFSAEISREIQNERHPPPYFPGFFSLQNKKLRLVCANIDLRHQCFSGFLAGPGKFPQKNPGNAK